MQFGLGRHNGQLGTVESLFEVDLKACSGKIDAGSAATTFPSFAIYSYTNVNGKIKTEVILEKPESSPNDLNKPMQSLPDQTQKTP